MHHHIQSSNLCDKDLLKHLVFTKQESTECQHAVLKINFLIQFLQTHQSYDNEDKVLEQR